MNRTVRFQSPDMPALLSQGYSAVDMHYHTNHSDGSPSVRSVMKQAWKKGCGIAITDHNTVSGVREAVEADSGVMIVPGIEVSSADGPHILLYFYSVNDLEHFYRRHIHENKRKSPCLAIYLDSEAIIERSRDYECIRSAAHPYGYLMFNKGVQRCIDRCYLPPTFMEEFDAVEVLCGGMSREMNTKAAELAEDRQIGRTAGTDGHLLHDLGTVVTCSKAQDINGFLSDVVKRRNLVVGKEKGALAKGATGTALMSKYVRYAVPSLQIHYEQNAPRIGHAYRQWRRSQDRREQP
jgi:predicted metal-dependent phosphoesterase TrpH